MKRLLAVLLILATLIPLGVTVPGQQKCYNAKILLELMSLNL